MLHVLEILAAHQVKIAGLKSHSVWERLDSNPQQSNFSVEPPPPPLRPLLPVSMVSKVFLWFFPILHQPSSPALQLPTPQLDALETSEGSQSSQTEGSSSGEFCGPAGPVGLWASGIAWPKPLASALGHSALLAQERHGAMLRAQLATRLPCGALFPCSCVQLGSSVAVETS